MSSDPQHPEGWRAARDMDDAAWDGQLTDADLRARHSAAGDRFRDPDGWAAMRDLEELAATKAVRS